MTGFSFHKIYFGLALLLFTIEILIAAYMHDALIRPYGGYFLVVILLYCIVKSFTNSPVFTTALCVLLFAYTVEVSQYFHLIRLLGLQNSKVANLILGNCFSFTDMLVYTLGILLVIGIEKIRTGLKLSFNN